MSDTISPLLQILLMAAGGHGSDWGDQTNTNLQKLEAAISGQLSLTCSGGSTALTTDQSRNAIIVLTGTLASNQTIVVPNLSKGWTIVNQTSGFSVTLQSVAAPNSLTIPANSSAQYYCDGATVYSVQPPQAADTGAVKAFAGSSAPINHILCYGQAVSRTTYAALFAVIGTTYGAGDGTTTFNLPDLRGRVPVGLDNMGGSAASRVTSATSTLGTAFGEQAHTLLTAEIPAHAHAITDPGHAHAITDPGHSHTIVMQTGAINTGTVPVSVPVNGTSNTSVSTTGISINGVGTGISIQNAGGGGAHNNLQPSIFLNYIIRI
jgi:microcystin-dependent protein